MELSSSYTILKQRQNDDNFIDFLLLNCKRTGISYQCVAFAGWKFGYLDNLYNVVFSNAIGNSSTDRLSLLVQIKHAILEEVQGNDVNLN